jgi:very-short-patch-repair endonuclease
MSVARARQLRKTMPAAEAKMWNALRELKGLGFHFRRQVPLGRYYADFACHHARIVVEIDGATHGTPAEIAHDTSRGAFMRSEGYDVLRITNGDVMENLDGAIELLLVMLDGRPLSNERGRTPTLNPSPQGGRRRRSRGAEGR